MTLPPSPTGDYYVIIGRGTAGLLDHATLIGSGRLSGKPPVVHIGAPDPWSTYYPHRMGQWPCLLTLPGYSFQPAASTEWDFIESRAFAQANADQAAKLGLTSIPGPVTGIEPDGDGYRVLTPRGAIRAAYVDVCGGPGPPRALTPFAHFDPGIRGEYETGALLRHSLARMMPAEAYLEHPVVTAGRVCVLGGGPTSAWCVERAIEAGQQVVWADYKLLNGAFVASGRNDHLAKGSIRRVRQNGALVATGMLSPSYASLTFLPGVSVLRVDEEPDTGRVELTFSGSAIKHSFDLVVVSFGQQREVSEPESWARLLDSLIAAAGPLGTYEIVDAQGRTAGLKSRDSKVRLLGAAALNHPLIYHSLLNLPPSTRPLPAIRRLAQYERSMPDQAGGGIALAAALIASANGYFGVHPNRNLNTADLADLVAMLGAAAAQAVYTARSNSIHPMIGLGDRYPAMP